MVKCAGSFCCSSRSRRTTVTAPANASVVDEPAPKNESPCRTARARALGARPPHRLGLDGKAVDVTEPAVERHPGFVGPGRLHEFQALGEIRYVGGLLDAEGGEAP